LAVVAIIASHIGPKVNDASTASDQLNTLAHKIRTEFAITCAVSLARSRGHVIPVDRIPWDQTYPALFNRDQDQLVEIFRMLLDVSKITGEAGHDVQGPVLQHYAGDDAEILIHMESQFADEYPIPDSSMTRDRRELSAMSYWNLRSTAELENWSSAEVLRLIEEHLNPALHPHLVHHSNTVSGADWRRLYEWVYRSGGSMLWNLKAGSNRKS
jgi:hypothetical protein